MHVRDIPDPVRDWIRDAAHEQRQSQNEFLVSILNRAAAEAEERDNQLLLFDENRNRESEESITTSIPFRFIDLFAGIGGMRIALDKVGGKCVFTSEYDKYCQKTYKAWFGELPEGDISDIDPATIPDHDVLAAGFPCQPFSIAGVSKKNSLGRAHGFDDEKQGNLFFRICDVIDAKRPPILMLENVKNLRTHDQKNTWRVICSELQKRRYAVHAEILDARHWVPQHRERIFIVGLNRDHFGDAATFEFPKPPPERSKNFRDILEENPPAKYTLSDHLWGYLQAYAEKHRKKGNGFGFGIADMGGVSRTLSARYYKDGSEVLIEQPGNNPRRLTPREAARLMGFPDHLPIVVSDTQAYKQFGNALVPEVAEAVASQIALVMAAHIRAQGCLLRMRKPVEPEAISA